MSGANPCFCMPLPQGVKIFSLVDMVVNLVHALVLVAMCFIWKISALMDKFKKAAEDFQELKKSFPDAKEPKYMGGVSFPGQDPIKEEDRPTREELYIFIFLLAVSILIHLAFAGLAFMLFSGNNSKNAGQCRMWFIVTIVLTAVLCLNAFAFFLNKYVTFTAALAQFRTQEDAEEYQKSLQDLSQEEVKAKLETKESIFVAVIGLPVFELITVLYKVYEIVVAFFLVRELKSGGGMGPEGPATMAPSQAQQSTANPEGSARSVHPSAHSTATGKNRP